VYASASIFDDVVVEPTSVVVPVVDVCVVVVVGSGVGWGVGAGVGASVGTK
jgi:hypothetical protein